MLQFEDQNSRTKFIHTLMAVSNLYNECSPVWNSDNGIYDEQQGKLQ